MNTKTTVNTSLVKLPGWLNPIFSIALSLGITSLLLKLVGANPVLTYKAMLQGAFGSRYSLTEVLVKATPLAFCGVSVYFSLKMNLANVGAEGQLVLGGITTAGTALFLIPKLGITSHWQAILLLTIAGATGGAIWGLVPGWLKAYLGVNETLTTLMFDYLGIKLLEYLYYGPWRDPKAFGFPGSAELPIISWLPRLGDSRIHLGLYLVVIATFITWIILTKTKWGFQLLALGDNPDAARYAGMNQQSNILAVMALSGAIAGIAGMGEIAGASHRLTRGLNVGHGFTAIMIAWLAGKNVWNILPLAFVFGALQVGGDKIQISLGLPAAVHLLLYGGVILAQLGSEGFKNRMMRSKKL